MKFENREEAGKRLGRILDEFRGRSDVIVLALPRGGIPVGYEVARHLGVPLDVLVVRKIGVPFQPELAMGAIASGGIRILNRDVVQELGLDHATVEQATGQARRELERREQAFRSDRPHVDLTGRTVILVDDGLATGATMRAALEATRRRGALRVVVAVPVAPSEIARALERQADGFYCLFEPAPFFAIGYWYEDFTQVEEAQVRDLLRQSEQFAPGSGVSQ